MNMSNRRLWTIIAGLFGFLGVALGAFGAHGLKTVLSPQLIEVYNTGILYHLIHSAVLLALATHPHRVSSAPVFFSAGIVLFSFSLYIYALTGIHALVFITPVGGVSLLTGWIMIVVAAFRGEE